MKGKHLLILLLLFSCTFTINAQHKVSGVITEAGTDLPLIGATIQEKDKTIGTITDIDGKYELEVSDAKATLVISYIGFTTQEIAIDAKATISTVLGVDVAGLNEVVVIGYGTQKKKEVTGAITKVKSETLRDMPIVRVEDALSGRTSGVRVTSGSGQPGDGGDVRIRGTASIDGRGATPIYVVDGVQVGGGIEFLNQSDIESIEVLKDASAGIYGVNASGGVIIITTKKGGKKDLQVNYNGYYGTQAPWKKLALLNAREYGILMNESSVAAGGNILFDDPESLGEGTDWQDAVFNNNAPIQSHDVNISGGNKHSQYYTSFSYFDQSGIVSDAQSRFQRFTTRLNSTHDINEHITFGNTLAYTRIKGRGIDTNSEFGSPLSRAINLDPITPILETDPDVLSSDVFTNFNVVTNSEGTPYAISDYVTSEVLNPVAALEVRQGYGWSDKVVGNVFGEVKILNGLKLRSSFGADIAFWGGEGFTPIHYLNATNRADVTRYSLDQNRGFSWIWTNTASYKKVFGKHDVTLMFGTEAKDNRGRGIGGSVQDIPVNNIEDASLSFSVPPENQAFYGYEYEGKNSSYFGRILYNYNQKYLFQALLRTDGSSNFGSNNKLARLPSFFAGWIVTEEDFLRNNSTINYLKIRASWGVNGNDRIDPFGYASTIGDGRSYTFGLNEDLINGYSPNAIANPDLRWEQVTQLNIGFDAKIFKKFSVTFDWYNKATEGMLLPIDVPAYVGNSGPIGNVASLYNKGVDLELGYANAINNVRLDIRGNISYVKNEVTFIGRNRDFLGGATFSPQGLEITRTTVGLPVGYIYGYKTDGIFQNEDEVAAYANTDGTPIQPDASPGDFRFVDVNENGEIDPDDRTFIGDPTPDWTYGFNFVTEWKGFDLVLFGQGVAGNEIFKATRRFDLQMANMTADALDRWTGEGSTNEHPRLVMNDPNKNFSRSSDFYVENGSFFRIKTAQIGYTFPKPSMDKIGFKKIRVYVSGNNLITFTKYSGLDPEIIGGVDRGIYPQPRFFLVGVNATF